MDSHERCQLVIDILHATRDGRDLYQTDDEIERHGPNGDGAWLKFLENCANGFVKPRGYELLRVLHRQVLARDYRYSFEEFVRCKVMQSGAK
jgi:hypothetical protein